MLPISVSRRGPMARPKKYPLTRHHPTETPACRANPVQRAIDPLPHPVRIRHLDAAPPLLFASSGFTGATVFPSGLDSGCGFAAPEP